MGVSLVQDIGTSVGGDVGMVTGESDDAEMGGIGAGCGKGGAAFDVVGLLGRADAALEGGIGGSPFSYGSLR